MPSNEVHTELHDWWFDVESLVESPDGCIKVAFWRPTFRCQAELPPDAYLVVPAARTWDVYDTERIRYYPCLRIVADTDTLSIMGSIPVTVIFRCHDPTDRYIWHRVALC